MNKYVDFITDEHFLECVKNVHNSYNKAKSKFGKRKFYSNKIDTIKLTFDSKFNDIDQETIIETEILRQIDKSINNSIGTFHEQILGGINGYESGYLTGYDIKAIDDTLFADIKNKHNTMNSSASESLFQKLANFADKHKEAKCYWVQILAKGSFNNKWEGDINGKEYSHSRVFKISGDQFYALITGQEDAFYKLYEALPKVLDDYLDSLSGDDAVFKNSALTEIKDRIDESNRNIIDEISFENFGYYLGFENL